MFREEHNPNLIKDKELRAKYERALEYYDRLEELAFQMKSESMRSRFSESVRQMNDWVSNIYGLALRLQAYKADAILNRDRKQVPHTLQQLDAKIKLEQDSDVRHQLQSTRDAKWQAVGARCGLSSLPSASSPATPGWRPLSLGRAPDAA